MEILDEVPQNTDDILARLNKWQKVLTTIVTVLCIVTGIIAGIGSKEASPGFILGSIIGSFCLAYLPGGILGGLLALFSYHGLSYWQKFRVAATFAALIIAVISLVTFSSKLLL